MNILLITDLEGIPRVTDIEYMDTANEKYQKAREYLTECINLVGKCCIEYGAERVYFFDGHGGASMKNVISEQVDFRLCQVGKDKLCELVKNGEISACIELGSHARAGTIGGFLDHTMSSKTIFSHKINDVEQSELSIHALFLGEYGVPTIAVIGDSASCNQAREYIPEIYTADVKEAVQRNYCKDFPNADEIIREAIKDAVANIKRAKVITAEKPIRVEITYYRTDMCEAVLLKNPECKRIGARTLLKVSEKISELSDLNI